MAHMAPDLGFPHRLAIRKYVTFAARADDVKRIFREAIAAIKTDDDVPAVTEAVLRLLTGERPPDDEKQKVVAGK